MKPFRFLLIIIPLLYCSLAVQAATRDIIGTLEADLNCDGTLETIEMILHDEGYGSGLAVVKINGLETDPFFVDTLEKLSVVDFDLSDNFREVMVSDQGPSNDPSGNFFAYDGEKIITVGKAWGRREFIGDGILYCTGWWDFGRRPSNGF